MVIILILSIICVVLVYGVFLILRPRLAINLQIDFYKRINWKMEPISMEKEIRNTRAIGLLLIVLTLATALIMVSKGLCTVCV